MTERKHIKIDFCQKWRSFEYDIEPIMRALRNHYDVEISDDPDYLFCSTFGYEEQKYRDDCIRIIIVAEYIHPNFNLYDYSLSFDPIEFGDRNLQFPLWSLRVRRSRLDDPAYLTGDVREADDSLFDRDFCSFVYSTYYSAVDRTAWLDLISSYRTVDSGGLIRNNVGGPVRDKAAFLRNHKFDLAIENNITPGHCTEKLIDAFAAGQVPIYLGDPEVSRFFNKAAFIDLSDFETPEEALHEIRCIDQDKDRYLSMLREKVLTEEAERILRDAYLEDFLCHIIDQDLKDARRRPLLRHRARARHDLGAIIAYCLRKKYTLRGKLKRAWQWKEFPAPPFNF